MITDAHQAALRAQLQQQSLLPQALDATADALRRWHAAQARPLSLADLGLYPLAPALDLTDPARPRVALRVAIGLPTAWADEDDADDYRHMGLSTLFTDLAGRGHELVLVMEPRAEEVAWWQAHAPPAAERLPPRFPAIVHGATDARAWLATPPAPISPRLVAEVAAALQLPARIQQATAACLAMLARHAAEVPEEYGAWDPAQLAVALAFVRLIVPEEQEEPLLVRVELDVWGTDAGTGAAVTVGAYTVWTRLDGSHEDDMYLLMEPIRPPVEPEPWLPIATDLLSDLPHLTPKRQATLRRLLEVVGEDGLRRLLRAARTQLAELALTDPRPNRPQSVRAMLWHMLQADALDARSRAYVLGLTGAPTTPPRAKDHEGES